MCRHRRVCRQSRRRLQRPRNPSPSRTCAESDRPKTPSSGQLGSREPKEPRTLRKSFVPAQCRGPYYKSFMRAITNIRAGAEITYNYGRDYLINVITRRGCKCDKCRKRRADVRAKARAKSRRARRSRRRKGKKEMRVTTAGKNRIAIYGPKTVLFGAL